MKKQKNVQWQFPEYNQYERSRLWYIVMLVLLGGLLLYSILTGNFLFAIILVLVAFISVLQRFQPPLTIDASIDTKGLRIGKKNIPFGDIEKFWLVYNPPTTKLLYITFKKGLKDNLAIPLEDANPLDIRAALKEFLAEDLSKEGEDLNEQLERILRV
ncbi:hypothetical protein HY932_01520 [Candidatus Falkowbacteria bacterium]|nr:hypothetical protein [Candidatus Falkowbacteria bacterium]